MVQAMEEEHMKEKMKRMLFKLTLLGVYVIGISTVDATSRFTGYQPEEGEDVMEMVRNAKMSGLDKKVS